MYPVPACKTLNGPKLIGEGHVPLIGISGPPSSPLSLTLSYQGSSSLNLDARLARTRLPEPRIYSMGASEVGDAASVMCPLSFISFGIVSTARWSFTKWDDGSS